MQISAARSSPAGFAPVHEHYTWNWPLLPTYRSLLRIEPRHS